MANMMRVMRMKVRINFDKPLTSSFLPVWRSGARHRPGGGDLGQGEVWRVLVFHGEGIQSISNIHSSMGIFMDKRSNHHLHVVEISRWRSMVPAPTPSLPFSRPPNPASSSTPSSGTSPSFSSAERASQWQGGRERGPIFTFQKFQPASQVRAQ